MDIEQFVIPIMKEAQCGCGFFVGNNFITAGHVVEISNLPLTIWFNGIKYQLNDNNLIKMQYTKNLSENKQCGDFAVFALKGINSPLVLADYEPSKGQELCCITYDTILADNNNNVPSIFAKNEQVKKIVTSAVVREERQGNFFACDTKSILHKGNSGCPLIDTNNRIVGILHGGTKIPKCCIFQYAYSIEQLIK